MSTTGTSLETQPPRHPPPQSTESVSRADESMNPIRSLNLGVRAPVDFRTVPQQEGPSSVVMTSSESSSSSSSKPSKQSAKAGSEVETIGQDQEGNKEQGKQDRKARKFPCDWEGCGRSFDRREHLARHERAHTKERPFFCHCGKGFTRLDNLSQHTDTHRHPKWARENEKAIKDAKATQAKLKAERERGRLRSGRIPSYPSTSTPDWRLRKSKARSFLESANSSRKSRVEPPPEIDVPPHLSYEREDSEMEIGTGEGGRYSSAVRPRMVPDHDLRTIASAAHSVPSSAVYYTPTPSPFYYYEPYAANYTTSSRRTSLPPISTLIAECDRRSHERGALPSFDQSSYTCIHHPISMPVTPIGRSDMTGSLHRTSPRRPSLPRFYNTDPIGLGYRYGAFPSPSPLPFGFDALSLRDGRDDSDMADISPGRSGTWTRSSSTYGGRSSGIRSTTDGYFSSWSSELSRQSSRTSASVIGTPFSSHPPTRSTSISPCTSPTTTAPSQALPSSYHRPRKLSINDLCSASDAYEVGDGTRRMSQDAGSRGLSSLSEESEPDAVREVQEGESGGKAAFVAMDVDSQ